MIIAHTADSNHILFNPETPKERKQLTDFPGLLREGLIFFCPNKKHIVYNLYTRLKRKIANIRMTPEVHEIIHGDFELKQLPDWFTFHTQPLKHQLIALRFAYTFGSYLNLSEPGLGKTKVTLDYIWLMKFKKTLIVCPKPLRFVWEDERAKHRPELSVYVVLTTNWELEKDKVEAADVVVINYDKTITLEGHLNKVGFDFIAVDEALIKDPSTERTKCITRIGRKIANRSAMSGTLVNNSPLDIFAPVRYLEPSLTGEAFGKFRDYYAFTKNLTDKATGASRGTVVLGYRNIQEVKDLLASCSIIMTKAEWLKDLPPKEFNNIYVQMADKQRDYYLKLASNYILQLDEIGEEVEVDNPLTIMAKLNQISNGFLYYRDSNEDATLRELYGEETKKKSARKTFFFEEQPKADALLKLIDSKDFNGEQKTRSIIWYNLSAEYDIITAALTKAGHTFLSVRGGDKDIGGTIKRFNTDPSIRFCVCQAKTINYGVTIMGTPEEDLGEEIYAEFDPVISDEIFYSINFSLEVFLQQQDRIHRIGQTRKCRYWLLLTNSKVERTIAERLEQKLMCNKEILVDIVSTLAQEVLV